MARSTFKTIIPKLLPKAVFDDAFEKAAREMEHDVKGAFEDRVRFWKNTPTFRGYVRISPELIYISVGTSDRIFGYVDQGTEPHIIKPVNAKVLHWVDANTGEDVFAREVNHPGFEGREYSQEIQAIWAGGLMADYFDRALARAVQESGHALK